MTTSTVQFMIWTNEHMPGLDYVETLHDVPLKQHVEYYRRYLARDPQSLLVDGRIIPFDRMRSMTKPPGWR